MNNNTLPFDIEFLKDVQRVQKNMTICKLDSDMTNLGEGFEPVEYMKTGITSFDTNYGGIPSKGVTVIAAPGGVGKSTTLMHLATNLSREKTILYISLENTPYIDKAHYSEACARYKVSEHNSKRITYVNMLAESVSDINLIINETYDIVFIDGSEMLAEECEDSFMGYCKLAKGISKISYDKDIPIVISWQANKQVSSGDPKSIDNTCLFYGTRMVQLAYMVLCLYKDKNNNRKSLQLVKTRLGCEDYAWDPYPIDNADGMIDLRGCNA